MMNTRTLAIILAVGAAAYVLTRRAGSGNSILGSLFGSPSSGPTGGTLAGTVDWFGAPNNSSTTYGPAEYSDPWELGSIFGAY